MRAEDWVSNKSEEIRLRIEVLADEMREASRAEDFEEAAKIKAEIVRLQAQADQIEKAEEEVENYAKENPDSVIASAAKSQDNEELPPQVDLHALPPDVAQALGIDLSNVGPLRPGFERFIEGFRSDTKRTSDEIINKIGSLNKVVRAYSRLVHEKPYKGNEGLYALVAQAIQLLMPHFNYAINIAENSDAMIGALSDVSELKVLNRSILIGNTLKQCFVKPEHAYRIARGWVEELPDDAFHDEEEIQRILENGGFDKPS